MKNSKIITILGAVTFFLSLQSMLPPRYFLLKKERLKTINPLVNLHELGISYYENGPAITESNPLFTDNGLPLHLAVIKFYEEQDQEKNKEIWQAICDAVSQEAPETSHHGIHQNAAKNLIVIRPSEKPVSVNQLIDNWSQDEHKKNFLKAAISLGKQAKSEQSIREHLREVIFIYFAKPVHNEETIKIMKEMIHEL